MPLCLSREQFNAWLGYLASSELSVPALQPPHRLASVLLVSTHKSGTRLAALIPEHLWCTGRVFACEWIALVLQLLVLRGVSPSPFFPAVNFSACLCTYRSSF